MNNAQGKFAAALDVSSLPSIPHVLLQFLETCDSTEVSFERLTTIVERDAVLSSKVIAAANTPVYAQWNELKEFNRVLVVLGLTIVKRLMDELGGSIACRSAPAGGARFQLLLPRRLKESTMPGAGGA